MRNLGLGNLRNLLGMASWAPVCKVNLWEVQLQEIMCVYIYILTIRF